MGSPFADNDDTVFFSSSMEHAGCHESFVLRQQQTEMWDYLDSPVQRKKTREQLWKTRQKKW